jgi:hypothetical protein
MKPITSFGFYSPDTIPDKNCAYYKSILRRVYSPGIPPECIVVRYSERGRTDSQYIYASIYDAMRQVFAYKECEYAGEIELMIYTESSGLEVIRAWEYEVEGYKDMDGDTVIDYIGWVKK